MIENVSEEAPALVPLFRSEQQMRLLGVLFAPVAEPLSIGELAVRAGVAQSTASREVARLLEHGVVLDRTVGRTRLVSANRALPWAADLQAMLAKTIGVPSLVSSALAHVGGVDEAWLYGSWAARYEGEAGPPPADIDVLVIGTASLRSLRTALRPIEAKVGVEVNPVVLGRAQWENGDDAFVSTVRGGPLVRVPIAAVASSSMPTDVAHWLAEAVTTRDLDRIAADMSAAGTRVNDARAVVKAARSITDVSPTLAIAGCHDASRKAITAHMVASGYRPRKGDGAHRIVLEYARVVLASVLIQDDLDALDGLRRDRADAEYGDFAQRRFDAEHLTAAADLAERVVNAVASALAGRSRR